MAETNTFTVDTTPETVTSLENLTDEEQDSLKVGEEIVEQQEELLAGKYKDAKELEKAYVELQKKLGDKEKKKQKQLVLRSNPKTHLRCLRVLLSLLMLVKSTFDNGNKLSDETLAKFSSLSSQDLIKAYMEVQATQPQQAAPPAEISTAEINQIKNSAGGEKAYANIVNWAKTNLPENQIQAFDEVVNSGSVQAIQLAVSGLKAEYDNANGVEGRMVTGKAPKNTGDVFRSQAELVSAMSDRRYDSDPAYRQDVIEKLERSDLEF